MRALLAALLTAGLWAGGCMSVAAQPLELSVAPILVIDQERLFSESRLGERISSEIEAASDTLAAENRRIEAELVAEELSLTERRSSLPPEEFRALADAFDAKVQRLRAEQDEKERALQARGEADRQAFLNSIVPVLGAIAGERGAVAILDRRAVFLSADRIDVTDEAIRRLNAAIDQQDRSLPHEDAIPSDGATEPIPPTESSPPAEAPAPDAPSPAEAD